MKNYKAPIQGYILATLLALFLLVFAGSYTYMELFLPSVSQLKEAKLTTPLRIFTEDGQLMAEFGDIKRVPVRYDDIPKPLVEAVLATEDKRFFEHSGVDFFGLARAAVELVATGKKVQGGSTITMQVARNFYLSRKKTFTRKFKEILLAIKIDKYISKQKILELYFNKVFLGKHAYGFGAAAKIYYGKPLSELNLAQYAMLAGLPKAPSTMNPIINPRGAKERRNHVLTRMLDMHYITQQQFTTANQAPITAKQHELGVTVYAPYAAELIRNYLYQQYGNDIYSLGLSVYTTIDGKLQQAANQSVREGLLAYNKRHGYNRPTVNLGPLSVGIINTWPQTLSEIPTVDELKPAAVLIVADNRAQALLATGEIITIAWNNMKWAQPILKNGKLGAIPKKPSDVLHVGDIIRVQNNTDHSWSLSQAPSVEGALISLDPNTGHIKAIVGGLNYTKSNFNRATQAKRQPGSGFKPFIYSAALNKNMTLASIVNDAPIVLQDSGEKSFWRPQNDTRKFSGPTRLRMGLVKSLNLVSIRVLQQTGINYTINYLKDFGFKPSQLPKSLSLALGTASLSPLQLARGYAVFANGGYLMDPYIITEIHSRDDQVLYKSVKQTKCDTDCDQITSAAPRTISPQIDYLITSALKDVIKIGTGRGARVLNRSDIAGKTGTTNDQNDAWFSGYTPNLVTITWVGFDTPKSLHEYGSQAALPIWVDYMRAALKGVPQTENKEPTGIVTARINPSTGKLMRPGEKPFTYEIFRQGTLPAYQETSNTTVTRDTNSNAANVSDIY